MTFVNMEDKLSSVTQAACDRRSVQDHLALEQHKLQTQLSRGDVCGRILLTVSTCYCLRHRDRPPLAANGIEFSLLEFLISYMHSETTQNNLLT